VAFSEVHVEVRPVDGLWCSIVSDTESLNKVFGWEIKTQCQFVPKNVKIWSRMTLKIFLAPKHFNSRDALESKTLNFHHNPQKLDSEQEIMGREFQLCAAWPRPQFRYVLLPSNLCNTRYYSHSTTVLCTLLYWYFWSFPSWCLSPACCL